MLDEKVSCCIAKTGEINPGGIALIIDDEREMIMNTRGVQHFCVVNHLFYL